MLVVMRLLLIPISVDGSEFSAPPQHHVEVCVRALPVTTMQTLDIECKI